jgi:two-component system cell cycle sensor histidine kinase/response regulator CckA
MGTPLRALIVEDDERDSDLLLRELRHGGYDVAFRRVETAEEMIAALDEESWDIVLSDYSLPRFTGPAALSILKDRRLDIPFIIMSGTISEEIAVTAMRAGARDFITKGKLARLIPAIERELREFAIRQAGTRSESARKRAEGKLQQLSRAVEQSATLVIITDLAGTIEYANPKFFESTGYSAEQVIGQKPSLLKPEKAGETDWAELWRTILAGNDWQGEFQNKKQDGSLMFVSAVISPIKDESGRITHFVAIQEDATQRREIEAQLRHSQKMEAIGQLTGGLAHDFNNLLGIIVGNLDLIQDDLPKDSSVQELVQISMDACLRGAQLNRSLLAFARRQDLQPQRADVAAIVRDLAKMLQRVIGERIELEVATADGVWPICVDPAQLESAILNLAVNARDAMPGGGRLVLEASNAILDANYAAENMEVVPGDYAMIAISDTGTGITPDVLARVFEPFFTTKGVGKGTGLGLSMVHGFIKQSQGHLKIYSEPGRGTTVRLYLPRDRTDTRPVAASSGDSGQTHIASETILVVEDNDALRRITVIKLAKLGYQVIETGGATAALRALDNGARPDLLFTDVVMPGPLDGIGLAREAVQRLPRLRVLLTSGFTERSADRYDSQVPWPLLSKPYRSADLAQALRKALAGQAKPS